MARRELLMLAKVFDQAKHKIGGYYMSEKLDGCRCFWDGGITRGRATVTVPWAGILSPKTGQPKAKIKKTATGLWSRYGNPIMAPDWFLNTLPCCPLDGELWAGRGNYQKCRSYISKDKPIDEEWHKVQYGIFGSPDFRSFGQDGEIRNQHQQTDVRNVMLWIDSIRHTLDGDWVFLSGEPSFAAELANLNEWVDNFSDTAFLIAQTKLLEDNEAALKIVMDKKAQVITEGGEGVFLRAPQSVWIPKRCPHGLKVKGALDDEGVITGFQSGRETDKGSKLLGLIGAVWVNYNGKPLKVGGFTDLEREFSDSVEQSFAECHPGVMMPSDFQGKVFRLGETLTFTYRELTDDGLPKEARFLRKR